MTLYLSRFKACFTDAADRSEISCSPERPPQRTATLVFCLGSNLQLSPTRKREVAR